MEGRFPFLRVEGSHHEIGLQIGERLGGLIRWFNEIIAGDMSLEEAKRRVRLFLPALERDCPHLLEEVESIAVGAKISLEEALLPNIRGGINRVGGCTAYVVSRRANMEGKVLIGQNQDMHPSIREVSVVLHIVPEGGPQMLMWTFAGLIAYHGFNSEGLAFFANSLPEPPPSKSIPPVRIGPGYMVKRLMLEQSSIEGVLKVLKAMGAYESAFGQGNYVLADRSRILDVKLYSGWYEVLEDRGLGYIAHTNHYVFEELEHLNAYAIEGLGRAEEDSLVRLRRLNELLEEARGRLTVDGLKGFLRDHFNYPRSICRYWEDGAGRMATIASIIAEPESRCMQVCPGNPCEGEYFEYGDGRLKRSPDECSVG